MATVVNPHHWLNEDGSFPDDPRLRSRILRVAQCIEYGGPLPRGRVRETLIPCKRRPGNQPCPGLLWVLKESDDSIHAFCRVCETDELVIHEWEDTLWADGPMEPLDLDAMAREAGEPCSASASEDLESALGRALESLGSTLTADQVKRIIARSEQPPAVLHAVLESATVPPSRSTVERLIPVLMDAWNTVPRPELGGRSPEAVYRDAGGATPHAGRNDPCPCGSGAKYKKCCLERNLH